MKVAVTSQNRKTITGHAGKCRKFWVFTIEENKIIEKELLELSIEQSFHASSSHQPHPLDNINILISGGMGPGLIQRMAARGVQVIVTSETDLDKAINGVLAGTLQHEEDKIHNHDHDHSHH